MDLSTYIKSHPCRERAGIRARLAKAQGVSEVTVRSWANGTRKHPCTLQAVEITEILTDNKVTRFDLRPDIFGPK
ncbi:MAG: YdaS family helix-turn-helix protein [Sedimenticola sp.]